MRGETRESEEQLGAGEWEPRRRTERKPYTPPKLTRHGSIVAQTAGPVDGRSSGLGDT